MIVDLQEIIKSLGEENRNKVGIYLPEKSGNYVYQFFSILEGIIGGDKVKLIKVDDVFLNSWEGMKLIDILIILDGEYVPTYYLPRIKNFLNRGGAIIVFARNFPFLNLEEFYKRYGLTAYILKDATDLDEFYRRTTAYMGIKCYTSDIRPTKAILDRDFLNRLPDEIVINFNGNGIYCNTSSERRVPYPPYGNVFPERYEVLRNYIVLRGVDEFGKHLTSSIIFTQNWENGSRSVFIIGLEDILGNVELIRKLFPDIINFCLNRVFVISVEPNYACYRDGEEVKIKCKIVNFSDFLVNSELNLEIEGETGDKFLNCSNLRIEPKDVLNKEICWMPEEFPSDFYSVKAKLVIDGRTVSKAENGFVIWKNKVAYNSANKVKILDKYFSYKGKSTIITGTNYYESHIGELMWLRPNIKKLRDDLKFMADNGVNYVRIHYHHPKWFFDYLRDYVGEVPAYFRDINFDCSYLPDEKMWRIFDAHIYLCQKFGIIYGGDLLTLVPEEFGDPIGWIGVQDRIYLEGKINYQKHFLRLLAKRYKDVPGIMWDLWNEPEELDAEKVLIWAKEMKEVLRESGDMRPITIGSGSCQKYEEVVDFYSDHKDYKTIVESKYITRKPIVMQEVWMDRPQTLEGDKEQANDMFRALLDTFRMGLNGFSPWQWTNQARLWNDYRVTWHELWDDRLGCCVRNDGTLKPSGRIYRDFSILMKQINFLKYQEGITYTDKGILEFFSPEGNETNFGKVCLIHYDRATNSLYAGIIRKTIKIRDKVFIDSDKDVYIWFFTEDEKDISQSKSLYIKTNDECNLRIFKNIGIKELEIVDYKVDGWKTLDTIKSVKNDDFIEIFVLPWHVNYWFRIAFKNFKYQ